MLSQHQAVGRAGELTAAIGVDDEGSSRAPLSQRHAQSRDRERSIEDGTHRPADDAPAAKIQHGDQIEPALASQDARGIGSPDLVGTLHSEALETMGRDRSTMAAVGGGVTILGALPGKEAFGPHEPGDAIAPAWATKHLSQPRAAVSLATARELLPDSGTQVDRLLLPGARLAASFFPVVIAAARDQERFA